jgi:anaerobic selenocysteine-containing dehydrogenase
VLTTTAKYNPFLRGITLERLQCEGAVPLAIDATPFADGVFPTPSGKVELYSQKMADAGLDPLPGRFREIGDDTDVLVLISAASHHFVSSSLASQPELLKNAGAPFVEIHPQDAERRGIRHGDEVILENERGHVRLRAVVTDAVRPGVLASPKGRWSKLSGGRNVNWTTSDELGDMAGQSTFHSTRVRLRGVAPAEQKAT